MTLTKFVKFSTNLNRENHAKFILALFIQWFIEMDFSGQWQESWSLQLALYQTVNTTCRPWIVIILFDLWARRGEWQECLPINSKVLGMGESFIIHRVVSYRHANSVRPFNPSISERVTFELFRSPKPSGSKAYWAQRRYKMSLESFRYQTPCFVQPTFLPPTVTFSE